MRTCHPVEWISHPPRCPGRLADHRAHTCWIGSTGISTRSMCVPPPVSGRSCTIGKPFSARTRAIPCCNGAAVAPAWSSPGELRNVDLADQGALRSLHLDHGTRRPRMRPITGAVLKDAVSPHPPPGVRPALYTHHGPVRPVIGLTGPWCSAEDGSQRAQNVLLCSLRSRPEWVP
jgi:hypothetical protein